MDKKICILSAQHLSSNPRVWKEANALAAAGYEVVILTTWTSAERREKDFRFIHHPNLKYKAALNLVPGEINPVKRFYIRAWTRVCREMKKIVGIDSVACLGYAPGTLAKAALLEDADLYIAHTELGLVAGKGLIKKGKKVAYDIEDWYSHDYLVPERPVALLKKLEKAALEQGVYCSCPSQEMADALQKFYASNKKVHVLYNGFSQKENTSAEIASANNRSLVWFSQTIGEGRGLETIIKAISHLSTTTELHLIGECVKGYDEKLKQLFPFGKGHQLMIHPPVKHQELVSILAQYNVGLAIESNTPENKNTTVANKILQYLQAGIKVLATDTKGQAEVAAYCKETVTVVAVDDPAKWAEKIEQLFSLPRTNRAEQLKLFNDLFSWEAQEKKLFDLVERSLNDNEIQS